MVTPAREICVVLAELLLRKTQALIFILKTSKPARKIKTNQTRPLFRASPRNLKLLYGRLRGSVVCFCRTDAESVLYYGFFMFVKFENACSMTDSS